MHWLFVVNNALAILTAALVARLLFPRDEPWRRALATIAGFPVVAILTLLLLGMVGRLTAPAVAIVLAVAAGVLALLVRRADPIPPSEPNEPKSGVANRVLLCVAVALLVHIAWHTVERQAVRGAFFSYDDLRYHAPPAARWLQDGRLTLVPIDYHATFPFNAELLSLWFILPLAEDAMASLSGLTWAVVALLSFTGLARSQRLGRTAGVLGAALFLGSSVILYASRSFAAVDMACAAPLLAAIAFAAPASCDRGSSRWPSALFCGLMVGLAVGARSSAAPCAIILAVWWMCAGRKETDLPCRLRLTALFAAGAALTGAFFYARTAWLTSNPLFPAALGPLGGPFDAEQSRTRLITWILDRPFDGELWGAIAKEYTDWPVSLFLAAAAGYIGALVALARRKLSGVRLLLLCLGGTLILLHPFMPYSATFNRPDCPLRLRPRYVAAAYGMGAMLFMFLLAGGPRRRTVWTVLGIAAVGFAMPEIEIRIAALVAGLAIGFFSAPLARLLRPAPVRWALTAGALVGLLFLAPSKQRRTDKDIFKYGSGSQPIGDVWRALEDLPGGSRVGWLGGHSHPFYPLFGRRLQFRVVELGRDGTAAIPLHVRWLADPEGTPWWDPKQEPPLDALVGNLRTTGVDYVLVSRWRTKKTWPAQYDALEASDAAKSVYDDGFSSIWRIGGE